MGHTLPSLTSLPPRPSTRTPSGRRKRAASSSVQAFFYLTQRQASIRKWLYAGYVYFCFLAICHGSGCRLLFITFNAGFVSLQEAVGSTKSPVTWAGLSIYDKHLLAPRIPD